MMLPKDVEKYLQANLPKAQMKATLDTLPDLCSSCPERQRSQNLSPVCDACPWWAVISSLFLGARWHPVHPRARKAESKRGHPHD